jgi:uncharacterized YccA/Bax inhibitor family protein
MLQKKHKEKSAMEETKNPALRPARYQKIIAMAQETGDTSQMTVSGAVNKTGFLLILLCLGGAVGWNNLTSGFPMLAAVAAFILSFVIIFFPQTSSYLAPIYALCEGLAIGWISAMYETRFPGIAGNAMILTFGLLAIMLTAYRLRILQATERFTRILSFSMMAIMLCYLVDLVMSFFGTHIAMIHEGSPIGIAFSVVVVGIASFNFILDFAQIEYAANSKMPKIMEWYLGFSLILTVVWLYLELLRLLSKLSRRN